MGDRNTSIGGNVENSIINTGDHNIFNLGTPALTPEEQERLTQAYLQAVAAEWAVLRLYEGEEEERGIPLTDVYVLLQARHTPPPKPLEPPRPDVPRSEDRLKHTGPQLPFTPLEEEKARQEHQPPPPPPPPPVPLKDALKDATHLMLLGEPGSGKSTTLQFIGLCFARREENWAQEKLGLEESRVPVLLRLPVCAEELAKGGDGLRRALIEEIARLLQQSAIAEQLYESWTANGRLLVLLDGLDEVHEQREKVREQIEAFARAPAGRNARLVVASRIAGFRTLQGLKEYTLQSLEKADDIRHYLEGWLRALEIKGNPKTEAQILLEKMQSVPALRRVLDNPLLLRLSAEVYARQGEIARNRADLYARYVAEAWRRAERRGIDRNRKKRARRALKAIAWHLHSGGERGEERLLQLLRENGLAADAETARELLALLRQKTGLLVRLEGNQYAFAHATIGEYFVACYLKCAWKKNPRRTRAFLRPRWHLPEWREPIILLAGMLGKNQLQALLADLWPPRDRFERAAYRNLFLAAELAAEAGRWEDLAPTLRPALLCALHDEDWWVRMVAVYTLRNTEDRDRSTIDHLSVALLKDKEWTVRAAAAETLGEIGQHAGRDEFAGIVKSLIDALNDQDIHVQEKATDALAKIGKVLSELNELNELIKVFQNYNQNDELYSHIVRILSRIGKPAIDFLVRALEKAEGYKYVEIMFTLQDIQSRIQGENQAESSDWYQKIWAYIKNNHLLEMQLGDPRDPQFLQAQIRDLQDRDKNKRQRAAWVLAEIGDPQAIPALLYALRDKEEEVRRRVSWALQRIFRNLRLSQDSDINRKIMSLLRLSHTLWRLRRAGGVSLLSSALTYRDALEVALSTWKDPLQPPPQEVRRAQLRQAVQGVGLALLAGLAGVLAILLGGVGKALGDLIAPLWAARPFLLLLAAVILLGALGWALQRRLESRK
ncbi:MAG: HEAT repeat domain-containing protein [Anaerolineales bacterium]